jgi:NAD/NADP transhydrogenase beta subunit
MHSSDRAYFGALVRGSERTARGRRREEDRCGRNKEARLVSNATAGRAAFIVRNASSVTFVLGYDVAVAEALFALQW